MKFFKLDCYTREKNFPSFITDLFLNYKVTDARKVQPHFFGQDPFIFFFAQGKQFDPRGGWAQELGFLTLQSKGIRLVQM